MAILIWQTAALLLSVTHVNKASDDYELVATTPLGQIAELKNVAAFGDAENRGVKWYDYTSDTESDSYLDSKVTDDDSSLSMSQSVSSSSSSDASSAETSERRRATRLYRSCHPCPKDMIKNHKNKGINWICGGYQRARRTFKSECMMRYRNCQDGTMFLKLADHRCKNDTFHGRHWFYIYKV